ncbi:MAG: peptidoglycan-binding protein [Cocleimonas sp.]|nr:peptidoglycan-binding protein [Cocleimonas sp.]
MNSPIKLSVSSILLAGILTGCSQQQIKPQYTDDSIHGSSQVVTGYVKQKKEAIKKSYAGKSKKKVVSKPIKKNIGMPPAKSGQCYAKVKKPATYKTLTKKVLVKKATAKRVLARGPQYRWTNKKVLVKPISYTQRVIPAVYKTVNKRVMVKPSYLAWKKGKGLITRIDHATGEILCRVKIPAVYKNIKRKVLVRAARTLKIPHAAIYKTVKNKKLISPSQYKTIRTPARYVNKRYRVKTASARYVWKQVVCKINVSKNHKKHNYKKKQYQVKHRKAKTYVKKYSQKRSTIRAKARPHKANYVKKNHYRKATYSRKMASPKRVRAHNKSVIRKASYRKAIAPQKARVNRYRPSAVKKIYMPSKKEARAIKRVMKAKPAPARVAKKAIRVSKPAPVRVVKKAIRVSKPAPARVVKKASKVNKPKVRLTKQNAILRIQTALTKRGFNTGGIDGKLGPGTVSALTAFQRQHGLKTGRLTRETLRALGLI